MGKMAISPLLGEISDIPLKTLLLYVLSEIKTTLFKIWDKCVLVIKFWDRLMSKHKPWDGTVPEKRSTGQQPVCHGTSWKRMGGGRDVKLISQKEYSFPHHRKYNSWWDPQFLNLFKGYIFDWVFWCLFLWWVFFWKEGMVKGSLDTTSLLKGN